MSINLSKGQRQAISSQKFTVGLGWDANDSSTGGEYDLDASVFILGDNGKLLSKDSFIYFNNLKSPDGAVEHTGDNLTGAGDGDDEKINIDLSKIDAGAAEICIVVTIYEASSRKQNFGQVRNSFIRIFEPNTNEELMMFELDEDFSIETAVQFGRIYKRKGVWKFEAVGTGMEGGLNAFVEKYK